jgi:LysM repeat protein
MLVATGYFALLASNSGPTAVETADLTSMTALDGAWPRSAVLAESSVLQVETPAPALFVEETATPTPTATPEPTSVCETISGRALYCIYMARPGDTLSGIAAAFGIGGSSGVSGVDMLVYSNRPYIADSNEVFAGQKLRIPAATGVIHTVLPGETVNSVAAAYGVTASGISELTVNGLGSSPIDALPELVVPSPKQLPNLQIHGGAPPPPPGESPDETPQAEVEETPTPEATATRSARSTRTPTATPRTASARRTPTPTAIPGRYLSRTNVRALVRKYSWPTNEALTVVFGPTPPNPRSPIGCPNGESAGNTRSVGLYGERGLFQIHVVHRWRFERRGWSWSDAFVAEKNVEIAYEIYAEARGWWPWSCRP